MMRLERDSPCKVNLLLNILGKRGDGFHELETLMHPVKLHDSLRVERTCERSVSLTCNDSNLPVDSRNLVFRAATSFFLATQLHSGAKIHLEKRIPLAAGLGGGSSNAAVTLLALNELFEFPLHSDQVTGLAAALGSDVPFFLQSGPAVALGRGEKVEALQPFPVLAGTYLLLIHPGFGVSTAWAYQALSRFPQAQQGKLGRAQRLANRLREATLEESASEFYNSLEAPVFEKYPILALFKEFLLAAGAAGALMSGSGSTTFAVFRDQDFARHVEARFRDRFGTNCWTRVVALEPGVQTGTPPAAGHS